MQIDTKEMIFVGDEEKDIQCASYAGVFSVLINRAGSMKDYGQDKEIVSLEQLLEMIV